jgi:hypothetical protein
LLSGKSISRLHAHPCFLSCGPRHFLPILSFFLCSFNWLIPFLPS